MTPRRIIPAGERLLAAVTRLRPEGRAEGRAPAAARREEASDARERGGAPRALNTP